MITTFSVPYLLLASTVSILLIRYAYFVAQCFWNLRKLSRAVDQFPMDKKHWLKGHISHFVGEQEKDLNYMTSLVTRYPKAGGFYLSLLKPFVVVYHPTTIKSVLKAAGGKWSYLESSWLGGGILVSNGARWSRSRKLLTPLFNIVALRHYSKVHNTAADHFLANLKNNFGNSEVDVQRLCSLLSFDIILRCSLSYESGVQNNKDGHFYIKAVGRVSRLWLRRMYQFLGYFDFIYRWTEDSKKFVENCNIINNFANERITERKRILETQPDDAFNDFLDVLLKSKDVDGNGLTNDEIRDEINNLVAAGYETTAGALSWTLYSLATNPKHQEICQMEIDELCKGQSDDYVLWSDLQKLPYLTMCIKESLRLYGIPQVWKVLYEDTVIDGKLVPAGLSVIINMFCLHRNPDVWESPTKFDPERFLESNQNSRDPYAFMPFYAGARTCLGQGFSMDELRIVLARTLRRFTFKASDSYKPMMKNVITVRSVNGIYLKVFERKAVKS